MIVCIGLSKYIGIFGKRYLLDACSEGVNGSAFVS